MFAKKIIAVCLILAFISLSAVLAGNFLHLVDIGSVLVVLVITVGMSLIALRPFEIINSIFRGKQTYLNRTAVDLLGNTFILAGSIGTFVGILLTLANLNDPKALVPGSVHASLTFIYGFILKFIIDSFCVSYGDNEMEPSEPVEKQGISSINTILGIILGLAGAAFGVILAKSSLLLLIDKGSILLIIGGGLSSIIISNSLKDIKDCFRGGFGGIYSTLEEAKRAVRVASCMYNRFISFGFIGVMIGLFYMFVNIEDPSALGPGMGFAVMSFFYGVCITTLMFAFATAARRQVRWFGEDEKSDLVIISPVSVGLFSFALLLTTLVTLWISFSIIRH